MVVTGRAALLALLLTVPVALVARSVATVLAIDAALLVVLIVAAARPVSARRPSSA